MNKMDKIFHDKLYNHSVPVAEDLWERFEQRAFVDKTKKRKSLFWILPFILCLGAAGYGLNYLLTSYNHNILMESDASNVKSLQEYASGILISDEKDDPFIDTNANNLIGKPEFLETIDKGNTTVNPLDDKMSKQENNRQNRIKTKENLALHNTLEKDNKTNNQNSHFQSSAFFEKETILNDEYLNSYRTGGSPFINLNRINVFKPIELAAEMPKFILPKRAECPKFSPLPPQIYLESYLSPDFALKYLESRSPEIMDKYKNERIDSERALISYSAGIRASWISGLGYGFKSGLEFARINERFDYTDPNSTVSKTFITIDTIFHPDGTTEVFTDTSTIKIKGETLYSIYNRFTTLSVPILLSYQWNFEQFAIGVTAGVEMNLLFSQKGQMLNENLYAQEFTTGTQNGYRPFKDNLSLSYVANIGFYYPLNKNLEAIIEPHFKLNAASITKSDYPLTQKFATGGLRLGLRYRIGKNN